MVRRHEPGDTWFQEGADARAHGRTLSDNPYCVRTDEHREWAAGWSATFDLDEDADPASERDGTPGRPEPQSRG